MAKWQQKRIQAIRQGGWPLALWLAKFPQTARWSRPLQANGA
jgi:hypothetical protein